MSWYANYYFFDTPVGGSVDIDLPLGLLDRGERRRPIRQIMLRYLGPV
jgi:hypothetical protein